MDEILGAVVEEEPERAAGWSWHGRLKIGAFVSECGRENQVPVACFCLR